MKKYIIIITILGFGILFTCLTCTYFNPWEAARIFNIFWVDNSGSFYHMFSNCPDEAWQIPINLQGEIPTCFAVDPIEGKLYYAFTTMHDNVHHIYKANYDGSEEQEVHSFQDPSGEEFIGGITFDHSNEMIIFSQGTHLKKMPKHEPGIEDVLIGPTGEPPITDIAFYNPDYATYYARDELRYYIKYMAETSTIQGVAVINTDIMNTIYKFTLHPMDNRLYWTDSDGMGIWSANQVNAHDPRVFFPQDGGPQILDLVADPKEEYLYIAQLMDPGPPPSSRIIKVYIEDPNDQEEIYITGGQIIHLATDLQ